MAEFTLGIEEEFQVIDPQTRELRSHMQQIVEGGKILLKEQVKAEMHQSVVEVGTNICKNIEEARREVTYLRRIIAEQAANNGLLIAAAGTHPFSLWQNQLITEHPRYEEIVNELQDAARANLIFGLHVHVGIESREVGVQIMNAVRYFLPHIFALSTNSPFWEGRNTGFKSFRTKVFDKFPRTGIPDFFASAGEYDNYIKLLIKTGCIDNGKKIWWDIRLHPFFETIEFRICDVPMLVDETIALAALMQALVAKIYKLMKANLNFRLYRRALINENKWRAARYGIEGKLIDFGKQEEVDCKALIQELLDFVDDVVDELGSRHELEYIQQMVKQGTGADRQLAVYNATGGDLRRVVDYIVEQTNVGLNSYAY
ncbi:carboxylate-amine ligase [Flexibacter flexilis DSM 6793]|uniref:Putative glutamate--cysteine ligase 2 n=1 Tax=Flexibacter flexilis DSM 6793 TaxID=927664 RepID=A0A1I1IR90_9BACT|nr:carboxylate-amine ligase [Flexibacter flexilis]SFC38779.1 carboxylate-amine ligase [Flexibacter flexilis DSM 6793]